MSMKISIFTLSLLLLAAIQPAVSAQANQNKAADRSRGSHNEPPAGPPPPPKPKTKIKPPPPKNPAATNNQPANNGLTITDWAQAITSFALLVVIVVQVCIYNKQRVLMWKQWIAMRRG